MQFAEYFFRTLWVDPLHVVEADPRERRETTPFRLPGAYRTVAWPARPDFRHPFTE